MYSMNACIGSDFAGLSYASYQNGISVSYREETGETYESATSHAFFIFSSLLLFTLARTMACCPSAASPVATAFLPLPCSVENSKTSAKGVAGKGETRTLAVMGCVVRGAYPGGFGRERFLSKVRTGLTVDRKVPTWTLWRDVETDVVIEGRFAETIPLP